MTTESKELRFGVSLANQVTKILRVNISKILFNISVIEFRIVLVMIGSKLAQSVNLDTIIATLGKLVKSIFRFVRRIK